MNTTIDTLQAPSTFEHIDQVFEAQQRNAQALKATTVSQRITKLKALKKAIQDNATELRQAIYNDFRKSAEEVDVTEIFVVYKAIDHVCGKLKRWMRPKKVATPKALLGTSSRIIKEPKGVALIIAPWNYPFQLTIDPLVYAIAAGNAAILKPSEMTPHTSAFMKKLIRQVFNENEVAVFEGDANVAQHLLKKRFDHIFFTGSPALGKIIMKAASEHLTPVTLELGGKSPTIVDDTTNVDDAAEKIVYGKFMNCGQTCIAPDYVLVHESVKEALISRMKDKIHQFYGENVKESPDLTRIVNERHFTRVKQLIDDAVDKGAQISEGGDMDASQHYIAPTLLENVAPEMEVMQEEIFGPVLPIVPFKNLQEATDLINSKAKPLALYIFSKNKRNQQFIINNTTAGGTTINDTMLHIVNPHLPFGGVNNSGIGKTHGYYGFEAFSNERALLKQRVGFTGIKLIYPPYTDRVRKFIKMFIKWA
ncbi:aldehyde dehydrogenase family protein [Microscilla marina]|uniref:Aldehyde dehydrogenase n=1 Tax=Microscilla marina ATCC 23134 TaxID=313606 RepID=A1ZKH0_MICM2|nr:aldehyde dehydrogenase family protein [Microscilla marina]EAY29196.1 aldehyde dehydrogenase [Microscilla marina ATCC 23134]